MLNILFFVLIITPPLLMISGFIMSITGSIILLIMSKLMITNNVRIVNFKEIITKYKLELLFTLWSVYSLLNNKFPVKVILISGFTIIAFFYLILFLKNNIHSLAKYKEPIYYCLLAGVLLAIMVFCLEKYTDGIISTSFRHYIVKDMKFSFALYRLDRGCAFLSVYYWILCKALIDRKSYSLAILLYFVILVLLLVSDSLAAIVAFIVSGGIFFIINYYKKMIPLFTILMILGSIVFPIIFNAIDPEKVSNFFNHLPCSAKERLFIWNYTVNKAKENLFFGIGINHSRDLKVPTEQLINYQGHVFCPFQLHPHNNILQILLELGLIGFSLAVMLLVKYLNNIKDASTYVAFISYYIIGMVSYSIWQTWWLISGLVIYCLMQIIDNKHNNLYRDTLKNN